MNLEIGITEHREKHKQGLLTQPLGPSRRSQCACSREAWLCFDWFDPTQVANMGKSVSVAALSDRL